MESNKSASVNQGGGVGEGFQLPSQVLQESAADKNRIESQISDHTTNAVYTAALFSNNENHDADI